MKNKYVLEGIPKDFIRSNSIWYSENLFNEQLGHLVLQIRSRKLNKILKRIKQK